MTLNKILIIRFSSIGDIVLTTPVIRCLKNQHNCSIHFLTKFKYKELLEHNPYIEKIFSIKNSSSEVVDNLKKENYNYIIDLHNNFRSFILKQKLRVKHDTVYKESFERFLFIKTGIKLIKNNHVVDRYFKTFKKLSISNDGQGLDYFINSKINYHSKNLYSKFKKYIVWVIGGTYSQKKISKTNILNICDKIGFPIIFIGGKNEFEAGEYIVSNRINGESINYCGKLNFDQSALLIKKSSLVLSNDTGFMHISAAFNKKIISFWGCTKPVLGMFPYVSEENSFMFIANPNKRPCSKHGGSCRYNKEGCINYINVEDVVKTIKKEFY